MDADDKAAAKALAARRAQRNNEASTGARAVQLGAPVPGTVTTAASTPTPAEAADREENLLMALSKIRHEQPGLVARQVHAELMKLGDEWTGTSVTEVRRVFNRLTKSENFANTCARAPISRPRSPARLSPRRSERLLRFSCVCVCVCGRYKANNHAGAMAHVLNEPKTEEELRRDVAQDHSQRDVDAVKEVQPALSRSDTRQRGDHLGSAAERGDTQQVKKLLKKGVDPNYANAASGVTPLGVASEHGHAVVEPGCSLSRKPCGPSFILSAGMPGQGQG